MSTVDKYFKHRELQYDPRAKIGDQIAVLPDTLVFSGDPFKDAALGVTPIYVLLEAECPVNGIFPGDAFYMRRPDGTVLYGTKWTSGETTLGKLKRHLHTPASHRAFWKCVFGLALGYYIYEAAKWGILWLMHLNP